MNGKGDLQYPVAIFDTSLQRLLELPGRDVCQRYLVLPESMDDATATGD